MTIAAHGDKSATRRATLDYQTVVNSVVALFVASGGVVIIEPSPYEFLFFLAAGVWFVGGGTIRSRVLGLAALLFLFNLSGFLSLVWVWDRDDAAVFQYLTAYLSLTSLFFALFLCDLTPARFELVFKAFTAGATIAAICAILGYFDVAGLSDLFTRWGRAKGSFKDPNVFGPFLMVAIVFLAQKLIYGRGAAMIPTALLLLLLIIGVLLSFSRGAWGATMVATSLMAGATYYSGDAQIRRRIAIAAIFAVFAIVAVLTVLMSIEETRELFIQRFSVTQEYDEGETGRFGNQLHSIPMLLDRFFGFGPIQFRNIFGIEPHSSYIGAFANAGWLGGFSFILLIGVTSYIGFRLMLTPSPFQRQAQAAFPGLFVSFLQAFQIDVDHWRHVYLLLGVVWGLEAARHSWEESTRRPTTENKSSTRASS